MNRGLSLRLLLLAQIEKRSPDRDTDIVAAYATGGYSYRRLFWGTLHDSGKNCAGRAQRGGAAG